MIGYPSVNDGRFPSYSRKVVSLSGKDMEGLISNRMIKSPHPKALIKNFELDSALKSVLFVLVPLSEGEKIEELENKDLRVPTKTETMRFCSQVADKGDINIGKLILFPHEEIFDKLIKNSKFPLITALVWNKQLGYSETILYFIGRPTWPPKTHLALVAK